MGPTLFNLDPAIRYVAVNQNEKIVEMEQSAFHPTSNPHDTDRIEELIVNPAIIGLARRRGDLDMGGIRYVVIRYGTMFQLLFPHGDGHVSVGLELDADLVEIAGKIESVILPPVLSTGPESTSTEDT